MVAPTVSPYFTPTVAKLLLEQIEAHAQAHGYELTPTLDLTEGRSAYDRTTRSGYGNSETKTEKLDLNRPERTPLLTFLHELYPFGRDSAFDLLQAQGVLSAGSTNDEKTAALQESLAGRFKEVQDYAKLQDGSAGNLEVSARDFTLDIEKLRDIAQMSSATLGKFTQAANGRKRNNTSDYLS